MSLSGKMEAGVEMEAPAHVYHDIISSKQYKVPSMCPEIVQRVDLIEGNWGQKGAVISWSFILDGVPQVATEIIEDIDDRKMSTTFKVVGGDILQFYKSFKLVAQAVPKGHKTLVNWTLTYEKLNKDVPEPNSVMEVLINETKAVGANLLHPNA